VDGPHQNKPTAPGLKPGKVDGTDGRLQFAAGAELFRQGDPGGDLFFIESGTVEIYTEKEDEQILLAEMSSGEIIGVMTCLTSEPRMASARARTELVCKRVPHSSIRRVLDGLPNWLKIVIKEFTLRLTEMNRIYSEAVVRVRRLEANQASSVTAGAQVAAAFASLSELMAVSDEAGRYVVIDDVLARLETVLNLEKKELERLFAAMLEAGLLRQESEPGKQRAVARLESAQQIAHFAQFVRDMKHGGAKKLVRARFTNKETRGMSAIVKYALRLDLDLEKTCRLALQDLEKNLEKATGVKFERVVLDKGAQLNLFTIEGEPGAEQIVLQPGALGRTVACIEAVRRLTLLDTASRGKDGMGKAA